MLYRVVKMCTNVRRTPPIILHHQINVEDAEEYHDDTKYIP